MALGLTSAFFTVADAVAWADGVIAREAHPCGEICDVAISSHRPAQDVANELRSIPGRPDEAAVWRLLFCAMLSAIRRSERALGPVAIALQNLGAVGYNVPRALHRQAFSLLARLDTPEHESEIFGPREDVIAEFVTLLATCAGSPVDDWVPRMSR